MTGNIKTSHPRGPNLITQAGAGERITSLDGGRWAISANRKRSLPDHRYDSVKVWMLKKRVNGKVVLVDGYASEEQARQFVAPQGR